MAKPTTKPRSSEVDSSSEPETIHVYSNLYRLTGVVVNVDGHSRQVNFEPGNNTIETWLWTLCMQNRAFKHNLRKCERAGLGGKPVMVQALIPNKFDKNQKSRDKEVSAEFEKMRDREEVAS